MKPIERTLFYCMVTPTERLSLRVTIEGVYRITITDELTGILDELDNTLNKERAQEIYKDYKRKAEQTQ